MCEDKGMGESASFVSGSSHHFPEKYRKLEKTLESLSVSFLFVIFVSVNISILKIKADIMDKYHYNDREINERLWQIYMNILLLSWYVYWE